MYRFIPPLIVLVSQDSNVALYAQVCRLCCALYMEGRTGGSQARFTKLKIEDHGSRISRISLQCRRFRFGARGRKFAAILA